MKSQVLAGVGVWALVLGFSGLLYVCSSPDTRRTAQRDNEHPVRVDELPTEVIFEAQGKPISLKEFSLQSVVGEINGKKEFFIVVRTEVPLPTRFVRTKKINSPNVILVNLE